VTRDPRLALPKDGGEVLHREVGVRQQREDPEARCLARRPQRRHQLVVTDPSPRDPWHPAHSHCHIKISLWVMGERARGVNAGSWCLRLPPKRRLSVGDEAIFRPHRREVHDAHAAAAAARHHEGAGAGAAREASVAHAGTVPAPLDDRAGPVGRPQAVDGNDRLAGHMVKRRPSSTLFPPMARSSTCGCRGYPVIRRFREMPVSIHKLTAAASPAAPVARSLAGRPAPAFRQAVSDARARALSRRANFCTLPVDVFGSDSNTILRGAL